MIPDSISRQDILQALQTFDREYRGEDRYDGWKTDGRFKYAIEHAGKLYPPKQIIVLAGDVDRMSFSGGPEANDFLGKRGFEIVSLGQASSPTLRSHFQQILQEYQAAREEGQYGKDHPLWDEFEALVSGLQESDAVAVRPHMRVKKGVGQGRWATLPWVALFDERETTTIQDGVYCVYLFREDMSGIYLTLNQGVTKTVTPHGRVEGRKILQARAVDLRTYCDGLREAGFQLDNSIDLHTDRQLGIDYEHSTVAHKLYERDRLPNDAQLIDDLHAILDAYDRYLDSDRTVRNGQETAEDDSETRKDLDAIVTGFAAKLQDAHLSFGQHHESVVRDFVVSLATKQLVILTGLSGSGKTQIALQFGRWLGENQYRIVPVRPDWTGPEALFGYPDALQEVSDDNRRAWHVPPPLEFMLEAARTPENPYLLILDEMNLAHVERYFADVISGMESDEGCLPNLRQEEDGVWRPVPGEDAPDKVPFPKNLFIAGTVNVDETTYMFSPKVLDRANTMEFRVETDDLRADIRKPGECQPGERSLVRGFLELARDEGWHPEQSSDEREAFVQHLRRLHGALDGGFSFGHRVLYEAVRFASLYAASGVGSLEEALDVQVMQKILPRLHGSRRRLEPVLRTVGKFCWDLDPGAVGDGPGEGFDPVDPPEAEDEEPKLPRSFDKVRRMTERLRTNQFVSFTE